MNVSNLKTENMMLVLEENQIVLMKLDYLRTHDQVLLNKLYVQKFC